MIYRYFEASTTGDRFTPDISPTGIEDEGDGGDRGVEGDEGEKTSPPSLPSPSSFKAKRPTTYDPPPLPPLPTLHSKGILPLFHPHIQKKRALSMPLSVKLGYGTKNWESVRVSQVKQTILVTSGAGYIGSHGVWAVQRLGYRVILLYGLV